MLELLKLVKHRYLIFYKPFKVLSQFTDEATGHPTLKKFIDVPDVYAAGRLDRDSEGLLLLTDDGALLKRLTDPKHHIEKTYWVMVEVTLCRKNYPNSKTAFNSGAISPCLRRHSSFPARACRPDPNRSRPTAPLPGSRSNC